MRTVDAAALWQRLISQRNANIEAGVPYTVNTGINQAIRILNEMLEEGEKHDSRRTAKSGSNETF